MNNEGEITPEVSPADEFLEISNDFTDQKELVREARRVFIEKAAVIADFSKDTKHDINYISNEEGQANLRKVADKCWESIRKVRGEIAQLLNQLQTK